MRNKLKKLVIQEAEALRKHATEQELNDLDFDQLDPDSIRTCIYGQMTGNCHSGRAILLLNLCTKPFSISTKSPKHTSTANSFPQGVDFLIRLERDFSPIEVYITTKHANNKALVDYLKGQRETLTIRDL